ncbi:MAG: phosphatase PAP2 family protein [Ignavibacteriaceae bacterium]|nr:phosphatase PAP2 family protein [Ignavibacteriaceae bacterium]
MKLKNILLFITLLYSTASPQFKEMGSDFNRFFITGKDVFISPSKWDKTDWIVFSGTVAATAGSFLLDDHTRIFSKSAFGDNLFSVDNAFNVTGPAIAIVGIYGCGLIFDDPKVRNLGLQLVESCAYAGIVTSVIKSAAGRSRPYVGKGNMDWHPVQFNTDQTSFPSGHATLAFAVSSVMANYLDNIYWKIGWYSLASMVGTARIYHDKHWLSDVVMGSAIGYFIGDYVSHDPENRSEQLLTPSQDYGINFSIPLN